MQLSAQVELHPGDLVFTGTPAGVGPLVVGDQVLAHIDGLPALSVTIVPRQLTGREAPLMVRPLLQPCFR